MQAIAVYDNLIRPNEIIREVIGDKGFGDVVVKRKRLEEFYQENIAGIFSEYKWYTCDNLYDVKELSRIMANHKEEENVRILHCFSNHIVSELELVRLTFGKLQYVHENISVTANNKTVALMFYNINDYVEYLNKIVDVENEEKVIKESRYPNIQIEGMGYIGEIGNFIQCITGNFDSRFFNSLQGNEYSIRKASTNKKKIQSEYTYYHLLPDQMKGWFVLPYDYQEDEEKASYEMERLHMTDIAIKWVHSSIDCKEFEELMEKYFYFFQIREKKEVSPDTYHAVSKALYEDKVKKRICQLKELPQFEKIKKLLSNCKEHNNIDEIYEWYLKLKETVEKRTTFPTESVIGHGDPCFANALYNRSTKTLKFIDPKGALTEEELWTNPYYDIAKLSHSVCGRYDFFNNAMFEITINDEFEYELTIPFDNEEYKKIFRRKVEENGYDYWTVRLYEASLFLSMLPLHIDYPHKVFGFLLNAINMLKEIEENV